METKQERLDQIQAAIEKLYKEKSKIEQEIKDESTALNLERVKAWGIQDGSAIVLFAKSDYGHHWTIAKTLTIEEIDIKHQYIDVIESSYHEADYSYFVNVESKRIDLRSLAELEKEFNIYIVDAVQVALLNQYFCELKLTYFNYKEYEEAFAKNADMSIKISV